MKYFYGYYRYVVNLQHYNLNTLGRTGVGGGVVSDTCNGNLPSYNKRCENCQCR